MCSILAAYDVPITKLVDVVPTCDRWAFNSYSLVWMAPRTICYYHSSYCRASAVTSLTLSPMSHKSPSISVMGSNEVLVSLDFFLDPPFYGSVECLIQSSVSWPSAPCCFVSSSSVAGEGDHAPLLEPYSVPPIFFSCLLSYLLYLGLLNSLLLPLLD